MQSPTPVARRNGTHQEAARSDGDALELVAAHHAAAPVWEHAHEGRGGSTPAAESPYLAARREWNERYGSYIKQRDDWRLAARVSWGITAVAVAGIVWIGAQNRVVPYVVQVDQLGATVPVGRADVAAQPDARIVRAQLARWVAATRSVYLDAAAERAALTDAYAMLNRNAPAYETVNEYMRAKSPFDRARTESVAIEVASVLPLAGDTWRVEWREVVRSRDGTVASNRPWQAAITIAITPPQDEKTILRNPMGIYVNALNWSERL